MVTLLKGKILKKVRNLVKHLTKFHAFLVVLILFSYRPCDDVLASSFLLSILFVFLIGSFFINDYFKSPMFFTIQTENYIEDFLLNYSLLIAIILTPLVRLVVFNDNNVLC
ncbi:hypothetical protein MBO_03362 [Moraxella bovoculi 237]|uniref:Uncharacterized protein n=1 Tax=Moraxella bovoculi 237 TaxID=743974 RepID=A0A066UMQ9_9GAMM|nr:hypothetical protein MBO_03362 [Moraxella bovoculi 237]